MFNQLRPLQTKFRWKNKLINNFYTKELLLIGVLLLYTVYQLLSVTFIVIITKYKNMKLNTLHTVAVICLVTLTAGILVAKAEGPEGSTRSLKASLENKFEKKDVRNPLVEKVQQLRDMKASTTAQIKDIRKEGRQEIKDMRDDLRASTKMMIR